ncbi:MAG: carboxypeptidase regulatory-like domain-containing protein, partial [Methanobacteriota archaeon]
MSPHSLRERFSEPLLSGSARRVSPMNARSSPAVRTVLAAIALAVLVLAPGLSLASGPDGRVRGYVTDYSSGSPIQGASVRVETTDFPWRFEATTDAAGYYEIAVPPHRYSVQATSPAHYLGAAAAAVGSGMTVWANVSLVPAAARSARLQGYVTDAVTSAPVATGRVLAELGFSYRNSTALNASGYYAMDLVPGSYDVQTNETVGYDTYDYYPVTVSAGNALWYNFTLNPIGGIAYINGTVFDAVSSAPIAGARIAARVGTFYLPSATSDGTGAYSLQSPTGNVEVSGDAPGHAPITTTTYVWGPGTSYLDLYLPPLSSRVHGYVLNGVTGRGLAGIP